MTKTNTASDIPERPADSADVHLSSALREGGNKEMMEHIKAELNHSRGAIESAQSCDILQLKTAINSIRRSLDRVDMWYSAIRL